MSFRVCRKFQDMNKVQEVKTNYTPIKERTENVEEVNGLTNTKDAPPDGGWGWVVVSVSFVTNFMAWGTLLLSGVLLEEFVQVTICISWLQLQVNIGKFISKRTCKD